MSKRHSRLNLQPNADLLLLARKEPLVLQYPWKRRIRREMLQA
jgi:hypothetical protein